MVQNAIVKKIVRDGVAEVSLLRQMECGLHCDGACAGCTAKPPQEILALATNPIGAEPGDLVEVEPSVGHNIGTSVVVFLLPCVGPAEPGRSGRHGDGCAGAGRGLCPGLPPEPCHDPQHGP